MAESDESETMNALAMIALELVRKRLADGGKKCACEKFHKFRLRVRGVIRTLPFHVRSMPASVLSLSFFLGLSACGPRLADRNIDAVNRLYEQADKSGKSLSVKEVEAVLGQPTRAESFPIVMDTKKELPGIRYYYKQDGGTIELHFIDNKLIRRVYHFGESPPEESEQRRIMPHPPGSPRVESSSTESDKPKATPSQTN